MKGTRTLTSAARRCDPRRVTGAPSDIRWWVDMERRYRRSAPSRNAPGTSRFGFFGVRGPDFADIAAGAAPDLDNGIGLDPGRMFRLLTEGNTDKGRTGAGAFGIGHLTAFAASDLRYVLYAGRYRDEKGGLRDVSTAHAILASRKTKKNGGCGGHGYWLTSKERTLFDRSPYPGWAPSLLMRELDQLEGTGSVVCVPGFNDFCDKADPVDVIARVAAKNFLAAIWQQKKRAEQGGGWLSGAYQALETLDSGREFTLEAGARVSFRHLPTGDGRPQSRVQVFRNGM